jgi:alkanesulfonate monooxygenase SsuD/methylene tetrahydromethanopterin reductase-like flavin-dependent oxidoreductase (luciferase family)
MPLKLGFFPTEGGRAFREALAEVERAEALGLDSAWLAEHHGVRGHYWPAPVQVLTAFAARTSRLTLGTNVAVFPFYHPVRLAEELAVLDGVAGPGRVVAGLAIGYKPDEFALYGAALEGRGARFEEGLRLMKALWTQDDVTVRGRHFTVEHARIEPRPVTRPHPPVWIGGWGDVTLRRAATLADAWVPGPTADLARLLASRVKVTAARAAAGLPAAAEWPLCRELVLADTDRAARELAERCLWPAYRGEYGQWRHPLIDAAVAGSFDGVARDRFLVGGPETVIRQIRPYVEQYGMTHLIVRLFLPGISHGHVLRTLELLAREVAPAFR